MVKQKTLLLIVLTLFVTTYACSEDPKCPDCPVVPAQRTIVFYSGDGICDGDDPNITVTSQLVGQELPAIVGTGASGCSCDRRIIDIDLPSMPIATRDNNDTWGIFSAKFLLPQGFLDPKIELFIIADDAAEISLNDSVVTHVYLPDLTNKIWILGDDAFQAGENVLKVEVRNGTFNRTWLPAQARTGSGDCMYVEFYATVTYWK